MSEAKTYINDVEIDTADLAQELELLDWNNGRVVVRIGNKTTTLVVRPSEDDPKHFEVFLNGRNYPVRIKDRTDLLLEEMGIDASAVSNAVDLKAPMPGLVLDTLVKPTDVVDKGAPLLVLEAMKMENVLKSESEGVIKTVEVEKGNSVEKGQVLITFE